MRGQTTDGNSKVRLRKNAERDSKKVDHTPIVSGQRPFPLDRYYASVTVTFQEKRRPSIPGRSNGWEAPFSRRVSRRRSTWRRRAQKNFERKWLHSGKSCGDDNRFRSVCAHSVECECLLNKT